MATWTQDDINAMKTAIGSGVLSVTYSGPPSRTVTYQSLSAMRSVLAEMIAQVGDDAGTRQPFRLATTRKGI